MDRIAGEDNAFEVATTDRLGCQHLYQARKVILATGYYDVPNLLNVPGEDLAKVIHYYKEPHPYYNHDVAGGRREELGGHRRAGTLLDRRARHADPSRRGHLTTR